MLARRRGVASGAARRMMAVHQILTYANEGKSGSEFWLADVSPLAPNNPQSAARHKFAPTEAALAAPVHCRLTRGSGGNEACPRRRCKRSGRGAHCQLSQDCNLASLKTGAADLQQLHHHIPGTPSHLHLKQMWWTKCCAAALRVAGCHLLLHGRQAAPCLHACFGI
jgi:hypothetical protein